jgi:hypothetical protein
VSALLARVFRALATHPDGDRVTVEVMREGTAVALDGNVGCCTTRDGALLVRPTRVSAHLGDVLEEVADGPVTRFTADVPGQHGWLRVGPEETADLASVRQWVAIGLAVAGSLPPRDVSGDLAPGASIVSVAPATGAEPSGAL